MTYRAHWPGAVEPTGMRRSVTEFRHQNTLPAMCDLRPALPTHTHEIEWRDYHPDRGDCAPPVLPPTMHAHYDCLQCNEPWWGEIGPVTCPLCGWDYVRCLDTWRAALGDAGVALNQRVRPRALQPTGDGGGSSACREADRLDPSSHPRPEDQGGDADQFDDQKQPHWRHNKTRLLTARQCNSACRTNKRAARRRPDYRGETSLSFLARSAPADPASAAAWLVTGPTLTSGSGRAALPCPGGWETRPIIHRHFPDKPPPQLAPSPSDEMSLLK